MGYKSKQTKNPGMVEDKNLDVVSIHTTNTRSGLTLRAADRIASLANVRHFRISLPSWGRLSLGQTHPQRLTLLSCYVSTANIQ